MKPFSRRLLPCLALALPLAAPAANLGEILQLARSHDAQYAAARAAAEAGREKYAQGRAALLPTVSASLGARTVRERNSFVEDTVTYHPRSSSVSITQPLYRRANYETFKQGELQAEVAQLQLRAAEQELLLRVAKAYFDVLQAQDALDSVRAQKEAFADQLAQANKSYGAGLVPITDVNEAQARLDLTLAQEIAASNDLDVKRRAVRKSISVPVPRLATLDEGASVELLGTGQLAELSERAHDDSLQVAINRANVEIARREAAKESAAHLPTVDLVLTRSSNRRSSYSSVGLQDLDQTSAGIEVAVPIFQGGLVSSRVREAAANLQRAREEMEAARLQADFDAAQAMLAVQSGSAMSRALQQALTSNQLQVQSTRRGLEVGVRNRVDVLNAQQQLFATRRDLAAARYQTLVAGLQLKAAAGVLNEQDVHALDALLKETSADNLPRK